MHKKIEEIKQLTNNLRVDFMDYVYSDDMLQDALLTQSILDAASQIDAAVQEIEKEFTDKRRELFRLTMRVSQLEQEIAQTEASD